MAIGRHGTGAVHADEELHIVGKLVVWHAVRLDQLANSWHVGSEQQRSEHWTLQYAAVDTCYSTAYMSQTRDSSTLQSQKWQLIGMS